MIWTILLIIYLLGYSCELIQTHRQYALLTGPKTGVERVVFVVLVMFFALFWPILLPFTIRYNLSQYRVWWL